MKLTTGVLGIVAGVFVFIVAVLGFLLYAGIDPGPLVLFIGGIMGAALPGSLNLFKLNKVEANTNGRMSHLVSIVEAQGGTLPDNYARIPRVDVIPQTSVQPHGELRTLTGIVPTQATGAAPIPTPGVFDYPGGIL